MQHIESTQTPCDADNDISNRRRLSFEIYARTDWGTESPANADYELPEIRPVVPSLWELKSAQRRTEINVPARSHG